MTQFILLSGSAGHGKDTAAKILCGQLEAKGHKVLITHYADLLKFICKSFFEWNGEKDEQGRTLLQYIGTDCVRAQNPNYWVDFIISIVAMFPNKWDYVLIPDFRFLNEIERIRRTGFDVSHIHVVRPGYGGILTDSQRQHVSENALKDITPDYIIENTTIDALSKSLQDLCDRSL